MKLAEFMQSLQQAQPPAGLDELLLALWKDAKGDWHGAHSLVDHRSDRPACWVHAYLHRKEGDLGNAGYWYRRAGRSMPSSSLQQEWEHIAASLLNAG
ncbi:MAG: hypothetical protein D6730_00995 [Bacteroidetes bacterium]|nr:MAG: hypothetical protein D6730_00995 [Bacteroidota bacterium]